MAITGSSYALLLSKDGFIVVVDNSVHVWHATIADLNCVAIEQLSVFVVFRKVPIEQVKEVFPDVRRNIFRKRRIEPYYFAFALVIVIFVRLINYGIGLLVLQFVCEPASV